MGISTSYRDALNKWMQGYSTMLFSSNAIKLNINIVINKKKSTFKKTLNIDYEKQIDGYNVK